MKSVFYSLGILAAVALSFASCQKQPVPEGSGEMITVTFTAKAPTSKSAANEGDNNVSYKWTDEDLSRMKLFTVTKNNKDEDVLSPVSNPTITKVADDELTITATVESGSVVRAIMASSFTNANNPRLASEQSPKANNYDPTSDILVSNDQTVTSSTNEPGLMTFHRKVVINKMTLHGIGVGEKIRQVAINSDGHLTGTYTQSSDSFNGESFSITLSYSDVLVDEESSLTDGGVFPVYFVAIPGSEEQITIRVVTDQKVYEKTLGAKLSFSLGSFNRFGVDLSSCGEVISDAVKYYEVASSDQIVDGGIYLITSTKTDNSVVAMGDYNSGKYYEAVGVSVTEDATNGNYISITSEKVNPVVLEDAGSSNFFIKDSDNQYLKWSSGNTLECGTNDNTASYKWAVAYDLITSVSASDRKLQYNAGSPRFACYTSAQRSITLYVKEGSIVVTPRLAAPTNVEAEVDGNDIIVTWDDITAPAGQTVTYNVTCTNQTTQVIAQGEGGCTFEDLDDGTYDISVIAIPSTDDYLASSTVTIGNLAIETADAYYVKVTSSLDDWSGKYLIVYEDNNVAFDGSLANLDATPNTFAVTISNDKIEANAAINAKSFTIAAMDGGYSIQASTGKFIGRTSDSNGLDSGTSALVNTIAWTDHPVITGVGGKTLGFNSSSNQLKFRYLGNSSISLYKLEDKRKDPGMSWSPASATASWNTGNTVSGFTAPTLNPGYATGITYESTNTAVATVTNAGAISVTGPGEATINAIFNGDADYKAATASCTISVTDNREAVATPVISPDAGTVASGTEVSITCTTSGATIHYTLDGTVPTSASTIYSGVITLTESTTVKAIAIKNGFKNSEVAIAAYVVGGSKTYSLTPDQSSTGSDAETYITTLTGFSYGGISWKMNQWNPKTLQIKTNQNSATSEFRFYNTSAFSGRIKKVVITFSALNVSDASKLMFIGGTEEVSMTTGGTAGTWDSTNKTLTWVPGASDNFTYFAFYQDGKAASGTNYLANADAIVVTYE